MSPESRQLIASQWIPACFLLLSCISIAICVAYSTGGVRSWRQTHNIKHSHREHSLQERTCHHIRLYVIVHNATLWPTTSATRTLPLLTRQFEFSSTSSPVVDMTSVQSFWGYPTTHVRNPGRCRDCSPRHARPCVATWCRHGQTAQSILPRLQPSLHLHHYGKSESLHKTFGFGQINLQPTTMTAKVGVLLIFMWDLLDHRSWYGELLKVGMLFETEHAIQKQIYLRFTLLLLKHELWVPHHSFVPRSLYSCNHAYKIAQKPSEIREKSTERYDLLYLPWTLSRIWKLLCIFTAHSSLRYQSGMVHLLQMI